MSAAVTSLGKKHLQQEACGQSWLAVSLTGSQGLPTSSSHWWRCGDMETHHLDMCHLEGYTYKKQFQLSSVQTSLTNH